MKILTRGLNGGEQYACSPKDVKELLSNCDISISFGALGRDFHFDGRDLNHPRIFGTVVASLGVNRRESFEGGEGTLCFFAIRDPGYVLENKRDFVENYLPRLHARYMEVTAEGMNLLPGIHVTLVEWLDGAFHIHAYRYT